MIKAAKSENRKDFSMSEKVHYNPIICNIFVYFVCTRGDW